ncbi:MAG: MGDG synthase family glycosyltransferase [Kiritimatiellia bacterium]
MRILILHASAGAGHKRAAEALAAACPAVGPDIQAAVHDILDFMPLEILATRARQEGAGAPLYCVVTDFAVHALWILDGVTRYYVATEEARRQLIRKGQTPERVRLTGIPVA